MVVFTCNNCGDSLQKPKVEKHYLTTCRGAKSLTCVDCFKDFLNEEYSSHIKCVTEEERYAAKGSFPKGVVKKGELKQESWVETVKSIIQNTPNPKPGQKLIFSVLSNSTNVPRKKNKFMNFMKSSLGRRITDQDIESVWNAIESSKQTSENNPNNLDSQKQSDTNVGVEENSVEVNGIIAKKRKQDEQNNAENTVDIPKKKSKKSKLKNESSIDQTVEENSLVNTNGEEKTNTEKTMDIPKKKSKKSKLKNKSNGEQITEENSDIPNRKIEESCANTNGEEEINIESTIDIPKKPKKSKLKNEGNYEQTKAEDAIVLKKTKSEAKDDSKETQGEGSHANSNGAETNSSTFSYKDSILKVLGKKGPVSKKKLQKKVLRSYQQTTGNELSAKIVKKFEKHLGKLDCISVTDEVVQLI